MDILQQIGQCFLIGFTGDSITRTSPVARDIMQRNLGGVLLFDRNLALKAATNNIVSPEQTHKLIADLQSLAHGNLLVAVDQEGGRVNRFKAERGFPQTPPAGELGQHSDASRTQQAAEQTASMLASLGINFNLAPVVDLNIFPENPIIGRYQRSFSRDPQKVVEHARIWIDAHHRHKIRCCLKHFPGHGSSTVDSHLGFVDISSSWQQTELSPYTELFAEGFTDAVMSGHLLLNQFDSAHPATLSKPLLSSLLRDTLGFSGAVLSDDLQMKAITERYGLGEACWRALAAGVDILVLGNNLCYDPDIIDTCSQAVLQAVRDKKLAPERIQSAWQHVQQLKQMVY